jgi:ABC-type multidrug transport system ATPase subunit
VQDSTIAVAIFSGLKKLPTAQLHAATTEALAEVGLIDRADSRLRTLSGGMLRRVGIASALVNRPDLLLLDEPTVGLDPEQRASFRSLLRRVGERSTVVLSTHLVEDVVTTCSDVVVLADGVIKFQGPPGALAARARPTSLGDSATERGYSGVLGSHP